MSRSDATKDELRKHFVSARKAMGSADRARARSDVRDVVLDRAHDRKWTCVAAYVPWASEPGSLELLEDLASVGVRLLVPVTLPDHELDWVEWPQQGRKLGPDAITSADAVLVPALAVATDGTRLGRGRGCYDRALVRRSSRTEVSGLIFEHEAVDALPADRWDVPVDGWVTPSGWTAADRNTGDHASD